MSKSPRQDAPYACFAGIEGHRQDGAIGGARNGPANRSLLVALDAVLA